jgi:ATP-dependent DNA ligase
MEAISVSEMPVGDGWQYEPKWDGFRCLAFKRGDKIDLQSKSEKLLTRCFPEVVDALRLLQANTVVLDGELVIPVNGVLSFDHLIARLAASSSMAGKMAREHPALLFIFDLLALNDKILVDHRLQQRRANLDRFAETHLDDKGTLRLSPATCDIEVAGKWLKIAGRSLDGVVAKRLDRPYEPGTSRAMQKIKPFRTIDCVVGGITYTADKKAVSYLHLGLYQDGLLNFVGSAPLKVADGKKLVSLLDGLIEAPGFTGKLPGELRGQFGRLISEWHPLMPALVAEVQYDHFTGGRFRHGAKFLRWRPDKKPDGCLISQAESQVS